jgi:tetratricopeptide (TPR) repeat protein
VSLFLFTLKMTPATWDPGGASSWTYLITQPFVIARYVWLVFLPTTLTADSDWTPLAGIADWRFAVGLLFVAGLVVLAFIGSTKRCRRPIAFGIFWFLITLVPSSSVVPLAEVTNDHRLYYPYVGLCLAVGWAAALWLMRYRPVLSRSGPLRLGVASVIVAILGAHAYGTYQRSEVWGSAETLWHDVTLKSPNNGRGLMNYGLALMRRGDLETALSYYERARKTSFGEHPYLQINLAIAKGSLGHPSEEVEAHYLQAIRTGANYPECHYWYASWLADRDRTEEAMSHANQALELSPGHAATIGLIARLTEDAEALLVEAETQARKAPTFETLLQLSFEYYSAGRFEDSIEAAHAALEFDPDSAAAYNNICSAYNAQKMWDDGISACDKALQLEPDYPLAKNNRQWAVNEKAKLNGTQTE